jgi:hypothetical protein
VWFWDFFPTWLTSKSDLDLVIFFSSIYLIVTLIDRSEKQLLTSKRSPYEAPIDGITIKLAYIAQNSSIIQNFTRTKIFFFSSV